jgi:hypothetical protein
MKKIIISIFLAMTLLSTQVMGNDYFEPLLSCGAAGGGAFLYSGSVDGNETQDDLIYAGVGCATGALIGYLINRRYRKKYGREYQSEIKDLRRAVRELEALNAYRSSEQEEGTHSIKIQEIVPGKRLQDGSIMAPTIRERLVLPGEGVRVGE